MTNNAKNILVLHGPNLNKLGQREPDVYGTETLDSINSQIQDFGKTNNCKIDIFQSNHEGELVDKIQNANSHDAIIINPAAYTHTSVAIRDAISSISTPVIEVHLSNIHAREEFRHKSLSAPVCKGQISGFGGYGYILALNSVVHI
tara:strand:- start:146 stop:583 length:438 start_codon:yes stop_codon:yes gene_type:complete